MLHLLHRSVWWRFSIWPILILLMALCSTYAEEGSKAAASGRLGSVAQGLPTVRLRAAAPLKFPGGYRRENSSKPLQHFLADCNSPSFWSGDTLYIMNSQAVVWRSAGPDVFHLTRGAAVDYDNQDLKKLWVWIESTFRDDDGTVYAWIHNEQRFKCQQGANPLSGYPAVVRIGALRSKDNGANWHDLGFVMEPSPASIRCDTEDWWYAGGEGDFFVMADAKKEYFYFYFANYPRTFAEQGICVARMRYADRDNPRGKVWIWHQGQWKEPGLGGHATPIFPATIDITRKNGATFWGPSIHWNTYLKEYVMVLNRIKDTTWATEGLYISFNHDISDLNGWSPPQKIMDREEATRVDPQKPGWGYYVQVMGTAKGETDKLAGRVARLFVDGQSRWEIEFQGPGEK